MSFSVFFIFIDITYAFRTTAWMQYRGEVTEAEWLTTQACNEVIFVELVERFQIKACFMTTWPGIWSAVHSILHTGCLLTILKRLFRTYPEIL